MSSEDRENEKLLLQKKMNNEKFGLKQYIVL